MLVYLLHLTNLVFCPPWLIMWVYISKILTLGPTDCKICCIRAFANFDLEGQGSILLGMHVLKLRFAYGTQDSQTSPKC